MTWSVGELSDLEINKDVALQDRVVKDEIDVKVITFESEALLAGEEGEAGAKFEEEALELGGEGVFEIGLDQSRRFREAKKLDHEGIFENFGGVLGTVAFVGEADEAFFVTGSCEALEEEGVDLAVEFSRGPGVTEGFDFVEGAGFGGGGFEEKTVM